MAARLDQDLADLVEHPGDAAISADIAASAGDGRANLADGSVAVVRHRLNHQGDTTGHERLVGDLVVVVAGPASGRPLDRPLDVVLRHVLAASLLDCEPKASVGFRIGQPGSGRDRYLAGELGEKLAAFGVGGALLAL